MNTLAVRSFFGFIYVAIVLGAVLYGGEVFRLFVLILAIIGGIEWLRLSEAQVEHRLRFGVFFSGLFILLVFMVCLLANIKFGMGVACVGAIGLYFYAQMFGSETPVFRLSLGLSYISLSLAMLALMRETMDGALFTTLFLFLVVWASDVGAYMSGKLIGGPKMAPKLSPKKTWAGLLGGVICAALVAAGFAWYGLRYGDHSSFEIVNRAALRPLLLTEPLWRVAVLGGVMAVVGQMGDIMISKAKRRAGVKDTGRLIPGHGGILDRIDSLLLVGPVFVIYLQVLLAIKF